LKSTLHSWFPNVKELRNVCAEICKEFKYMALQGNKECRCGNSFGQKGKAFIQTGDDVDSVDEGEAQSFGTNTTEDGMSFESTATMDTGSEELDGEEAEEGVSQLDSMPDDVCTNHDGEEVPCLDLYNNRMEVGASGACSEEFPYCGRFGYCFKKNARNWKSGCGISGYYNSCWTSAGGWKGCWRDHPGFTLEQMENRDRKCSCGSASTQSKWANCVYEVKTLGRKKQNLANDKIWHVFTMDLRDGSIRHSDLIPYDE